MPMAVTQAGPATPCFWGESHWLSAEAMGPQGGQCVSPQVRWSGLTAVGAAAGFRETEYGFKDQMRDLGCGCGHFGTPQTWR